MVRCWRWRCAIVAAMMEDALAVVTVLVATNVACGGAVWTQESSRSRLWQRLEALLSCQSSFVFWNDGSGGAVASVGTFGVCDLGSLFWQDGLFRRHPSSCFGGVAPSSSLAQSLNCCHRATIVDPSWVTNLWQFQDPNYGILEISFSLNLMH